MAEITPETLEALAGIMTQLRDQASVTSFLKLPNVHKDNAARFLAYLISFGIIPPGPEAIVTSIARICEDYALRMNNSLGDSKDSPLVRLSQIQASTISGDLTRAVSWFATKANEIGIPKQERPDPILPVTRVLVLLALSSSDNDYIQGYDRLALLSYALALRFVLDVHIPTTALVAETLTSFLTEKLIGLSEAPQLLTDNLDTILRFYKTDRHIKKLYPNVAARLREDQACARHFALTWELSLWSDRHHANDLFLLWDGLIANRNHLLKYKRALTLAHIAQVQVNEGGFILQDLMEYNGWDVVELMKNAERLAKGRDKTNVTAVALCAVGCAIVGAGIAIIALRRRRQN
jgi:hypothetical protein